MNGLQLNLLVQQPKPLTKEKLFSQRKIEQLKDVLSPERIDFYKTNTRFVSYEEFLYKLSEMRDWLNKSIDNRDNTIFFSPGGQDKSNYWVAEHFYKNLKMLIPNYSEYNTIAEKLPDHIIIADDGVYTGAQLGMIIGGLLEVYGKVNKKIHITLAIPFIGLAGLKRIKHIEETSFNMISISIPPIAEVIQVYDPEDDILIKDIENVSFARNYNTLLLFQHKKGFHRCIGDTLSSITYDINPPYK